MISATILPSRGSARITFTEPYEAAQLRTLLEAAGIKVAIGDFEG